MVRKQLNKRPYNADTLSEAEGSLRRYHKDILYQEETAA